MTKCHIEFRNNNNLEIVHHLIYDTDCGPSFWADGLVFLDSLQLDPPTFRQSLITKINHRLEHNILATFISTIEAAVEAYKPVQNHKHFLESKVDPYPVILLLLFERLILFPILKEDDNKPHTQQSIKNHKMQSTSVNQAIHDRIRRFKQGRIRELYAESNTVVSKTPKQLAENPSTIQKSAQLSANLYQWHLSMPSISPSSKSFFQNLFNSTM